MLLIEDGSNDFDQIAILGKRDKNPSEMIAKRPFIFWCNGQESMEVDMVRNHLVKTPLTEVRLSRKQFEKLVDFLCGSQWRAIALIQLADLLKIEIRQH